MLRLPSFAGRTPPLVYALTAPALLVSQHLAVLLIYRLAGWTLLMDGDFLMLPLRRLALMPDLSAIGAAAAFAWSLLIAWGLALLSFRRARWSGWRLPSRRADDRSRCPGCRHHPPRAAASVQDEGGGSAGERSRDRHACRPCHPGRVGGRRDHRPGGAGLGRDVRRLRLGPVRDDAAARWHDHRLYREPTHRDERARCCQSNANCSLQDADRSMRAAA